MRREATWLATSSGLPYAAVALELWRRWREETDPATRRDLSLALGDLLAKYPSDGECLPVMRAAVRYLAAIGAPAAPAEPIDRAVLDNPRRLAYFGSWRSFTEDEELRRAAAILATLAG